MYYTHSPFISVQLFIVHEDLRSSYHKDLFSPVTIKSKKFKINCLLVLKVETTLKHSNFLTAMLILAWFWNSWSILTLASCCTGGLEHYKEYKPGVDVHYSSGIYNKAFCILSKTKYWNYMKAFQVCIYKDLQLHCILPSNSTCTRHIHGFMTILATVYWTFPIKIPQHWPSPNDSFGCSILFWVNNNGAV